MLTKLNTLREEHEDGFTLIELLVVILIIGILAAIAIPVFLNQRKTANDGTVQSDVKNAATQIESWIVGQGGGNNPITSAALTDIKKSTGVALAVRGTTNGYCIKGVHTNGKNYLGTTAATAAVGSSLTYESSLGGLDKGKAGTPAAFTGACVTPTTSDWIVVP